MACGTAAVVIGIKRLVFEDGSSLELPGSRPRGGDVEALQRAGRHPVRPRADRHGWVREVCRVETSATR